jgi:hypothetical protein
MSESAPQVLSDLTAAILANDPATITTLLRATPALATEAFTAGADRQTSTAFFINQIRRYIYKGDTALHIAAAAHHTEAVRVLLGAGALVTARNRFGDEPIHAAAIGRPDSPEWSPAAQSATLACLIEAGANPNTTNKRGVSPLHVAVRTRSAAAVQTLLQHGADATMTNGNGSTPALLATLNTGRSGSGLPEAKAQAQAILQLLNSWQPAS